MLKVFTAEAHLQQMRQDLPAEYADITALAPEE